jgi:ATP-binding cassette, subfamily G (WHITE), member 2, SNQ2
MIDGHILSSNGVMQPYSQLGWWKWMYRLTPYTYLIEGLLGQGMFPFRYQYPKLI